jgi:hypothetical protein
MWMQTAGCVGLPWPSSADTPPWSSSRRQRVTKGAAARPNRRRPQGRRGRAERPGREDRPPSPAYGSNCDKGVDVRLASAGTILTMRGVLNAARPRRGRSRDMTEAMTRMLGGQVQGRAAR